MRRINSNVQISRDGHNCELLLWIFLYCFISCIGFREVCGGSYFTYVGVSGEIVVLYRFSFMVSCIVDS